MGFRKQVLESEPFGRLIINGDLFDDCDFGRLRKHHWHVLSIIRKLSKEREIVYIRGNHDLPADCMSHLLGVDVVEDYAFYSDNKSVYCHHGHRYDKFLSDHPILTWMGDAIYWLLQKLDPSFRLPLLAKRSSKTFLRSSEIIERKSLDYIRRHGHDAVCVGHTHFPMERDGYYNSGSWTELPCTYLLIDGGNICLKIAAG